MFIIDCLNDTNYWFIFKHITSLEFFAFVPVYHQKTAICYFTSNLPVANVKIYCINLTSGKTGNHDLQF